jgi:hypothetical protein
MFMNMLPVGGTEPEDVADTALFLAPGESKFITAHEIAPDAGNAEFRPPGAEGSRGRRGGATVRSEEGTRR